MIFTIFFNGISLSFDEISFFFMIIALRLRCVPHVDDVAPARMRVDAVVPAARLPFGFTHGLAVP